MYFDAEQYKDAKQWYEAALKLDPNNADISTDLGVGYYYLNQPDRALAQFDRSLQIDSKHTKTLLNVGIVRAFGKQDLAGAAKAWEQVLALAPASPEGQAAKRALDAMKGAHPNLPAAPHRRRPRPGPTEGPRHGIPPARGPLSHPDRCPPASAYRFLEGVIEGATGGGPAASNRSGGPGTHGEVIPVCGTYVVPGPRPHCRARTADGLVLLAAMPAGVAAGEGLAVAEVAIESPPRRHRRDRPASVQPRVTCASNDGNISIRFAPDRVLTTPKNVSKGYMTPDMMVVVDIDGRKVAGDRDASSELLMHLEVYRQRPDVNAVVHAHPPLATGFAVAGVPLDRAVLAEVIARSAAFRLSTTPRRRRPSCRPPSGNTSRRTTACCWPITAR